MACFVAKYFSFCSESLRGLADIAPDAVPNANIGRNRSVDPRDDQLPIIHGQRRDGPGLPSHLSASKSAGAVIKIAHRMRSPAALAFL